MPPQFLSGLADQTIKIGEPAIVYTLPAVLDPENDAIWITVKVNGGSTLPGFITLSGSTIRIAPTVNSESGTYETKFILRDAFGEHEETFKIRVRANVAPSFITHLEDQTITAGESLIYSLPLASDPEGDAISLTVLGCD
jgi:hypothetical protein